jgi:large subunit ribosomal protein L2
VDHPHGGGQGKTSGGRPSVTFKAWPTKGQPTRSPKRRNSFILTPRKRLN